MIQERAVLKTLSTNFGEKITSTYPNENSEISTQALIAFKDALANVYWRKKELRQFIELTIENPYIVSTIDWQENPKYESVSQLIDRMAAKQNI